MTICQKRRDIIVRIEKGQVEVFANEACYLARCWRIHSNIETAAALDTFKLSI